MRFDPEALKHRPWALPESSWSVAMRWEDLLFAHWPVNPSALQALLPAGLELDLFDGQAWLGVVPFRMCATRLRWLPPMPGTDAFPELNVRTYVRRAGKAGVWFFSLDAGSMITVRTARRFFHLPYFDARMSAPADGERVTYSSRRTHRNAPETEFRATFGPASEVMRSQPGSVEHWLTERYCLFSADPRGNIWCGEIHHAPWPLQRAEAEIEVNTMARPIGLELSDRPALLHFARGLDVVGWKIRPA
jgi:uncharacterized protein YqjF (DUF2071 family)